MAPQISACDFNFFILSYGACTYALLTVEDC